MPSVIIRNGEEVATILYVQRTQINHVQGVRRFGSANVDHEVTYTTTRFSLSVDRPLPFSPNDAGDIRLRLDGEGEFSVIVTRIKTQIAGDAGNPAENYCILTCWPVQ